jgi:hypothetical protein
MSSDCELRIGNVTTSFELLHDQDPEHLGQRTPETLQHRSAVHVDHGSPADLRIHQPHRRRGEHARQVFFFEQEQGPPAD